MLVRETILGVLLCDESASHKGRRVGERLTTKHETPLSSVRAAKTKVLDITFATPVSCHAQNLPFPPMGYT